MIVQFIWRALSINFHAVKNFLLLSPTFTVTSLFGKHSSITFVWYTIHRFDTQGKSSLVAAYLWLNGFRAWRVTRFSDFQLLGKIWKEGLIKIEYFIDSHWSTPTVLPIPKFCPSHSQTSPGFYFRVSFRTTPAPEHTQLFDADSFIHSMNAIKLKLASLFSAVSTLAKSAIRWSIGGFTFEKSRYNLSITNRLGVEGDSSVVGRWRFIGEDENG